MLSDYENKYTASGELVSVYIVLFSRLQYNLKYLIGVRVRFITAMASATDNRKETEDIIQNKNGTRYKKRFMKRQWEEHSTKRDEGETEEKKQCNKPVERIKRKKMAMLLGYCGVDYYGMQR